MHRQTPYWDGDADQDGDVDLDDFAVFVDCLAGPGAEPTPTPPVGAQDCLAAFDFDEDGAWSNSTAKSSAAGLTGLGSRYITYELPNSGTDNATFVPNLTKAGLYEVVVSWGTGANCYDAQYTIQHRDGQTVLLVDQIPEGASGANANTWVSLGQYWFDAGQDAATSSINVSEETVSGKPHSSWNQRVYADAAKWVFLAR